MKTKFTITDELNVTSRTAKISLTISGVSGDEDKKSLEAKSLAKVKELFPDASWAFTSLVYANNLTFSLQASTRIDATENEKLEERIRAISNNSIQLSNLSIDPSVPIFQMREEESTLRSTIIQTAVAEATKLGGIVSKIVFTDAHSLGSTSNSKGAFRAMAAGTYSDGGMSLGHTEKISMSAVITVKVNA